MCSSPVPIVLFHPSICSPHIIQAEIQQVLTQPAQLRTSIPVPQHIIMRGHLHTSMTRLTSSLAQIQVSSS